MNSSVTGAAVIGCGHTICGGLPESVVSCLGYPPTAQTADADAEPLRHLPVILAGMGWGGLPEHVGADPLVSLVLVRLAVPEFEVRAMELFAMRRRDRPHGVVAQALWEALARSGPASPARLRHRSRAAP